MGRWGHPYEIAELIGFLVSPGAGFVSGVDILADGDQTANTLVKGKVCVCKVCVVY